jgi:prepilin-type N-terminal cleavage/methylation domain-containing protein
MRSSTESRPQTARAGFTLVELMIVVVILGILAAVSLPTLSSYIYKSKAVEATGFLNEIKARQESYRADFGSYCNVSGSVGTLFPLGPPRSTVRRWDAVPPGWTQLGVVPPGRVSLFSYATVAGIPGTPPGPAVGLSDARGYDGNDFWFISTAVGDLDGDGTSFSIESYSHSKALWTSNASGWE